MAGEPLIRDQPGGWEKPGGEGGVGFSRGAIDRPPASVLYLDAGSFGEKLDTSRAGGGRA